MEAVIATGGKQYRVAPGQVIAVEKLPGDKGAPVEFTSVLLVARDGEVIAGPDRLKSARVSGEVVGRGSDDTLCAKVSGVVQFERRGDARYISVVAPSS